MDLGVALIRRRGTPLEFHNAGVSNFQGIFDGIESLICCLTVGRNERNKRGIRKSVVTA